MHSITYNTDFRHCLNFFFRRNLYLIKHRSKKLFSFKVLNPTIMTTSSNAYNRMGNDFIAQLALELNLVNDTPRVFSKLKAVLKSIRNHLTSEASAEFLLQLPGSIKNIYTDGSSAFRKQKELSSITELLNEIYKNGDGVTGQTFNCKCEVEIALKAFFKILEYNSTESEFEKILMFMPLPLRHELFDCVMDGACLII